MLRRAGRVGDQAPVRGGLHGLDRAESLPGVDEIVLPGPACGEVEAGAACVSGDSAGDVEEAVAEAFRLPASRRGVGE